jgi:hypothetical protein
LRLRCRWQRILCAPSPALLCCWRRSLVGFLVWTRGWSSYAASAGAGAGDLGEQSILHTRGTQMASPWCVSVHGASSARDEQRISDRSRRREVEVYRFWVGGSCSQLWSWPRCLASRISFVSLGWVVHTREKSNSAIANLTCPPLGEVKEIQIAHTYHCRRCSPHHWPTHPQMTLRPA